LLKKYTAPVLGGVVGALIVGAAWYGTYAVSQKGAVVAKVGDTPITRTALLTGTESLSGTQILSELITNELVRDAAKKANISASQSEVSSALSDIEKQNGITSDADLTQALAQSHMTKDELMSQLEVQVLENKLAEGKVNVTDKQIQDFYNKNKGSLPKVNSKVPTLAQAKQTIIDNIKKQNAEQPAQLIADLAKQNPITIVDTSYSSVKASIENPAPAMPGATGQ
jgi:foldase protein PrsA